MTILSIPGWKARQMGPPPQTRNTTHGAGLEGNVKSEVCVTGSWRQRFGSPDRGPKDGDTALGDIHGEALVHATGGRSP